MTAPASDINRNMAGRQLGRYEVLTQLASGGMAAVYVARARGVAGFERLVAVKVLHPHLAYEEEFISMFLDEARLAARIRHPNVVPTLDISDTEGDGFFLVMEYIEGDHLGAMLGAAAREGERVPTAVIVRVLLDALGGLGAAHNLTDETGDPLHLVHRDVSPHNVMVGVDGIARLTDFGVAKAEKRLTTTRAGQFKGKLAYMAPEQASSGYADQRSDLFSMGIILWESLTGRRLFRGENNASTLNKILQEPIPPPSALFPDLAPFDEVCLKALSREPDDRFQSADEFAEAIERVARESGAGIATPRKVSAQVKQWLVDKLKAQRARIQESIMELGHSGIGEAAMPIPREGSASSASLSGVPLPSRGPADQTLSAPNAPAVSPVSVSGTPIPTHEDDQRRKVMIFGGAAAATVLLVGGLAVAFLSGGDDPEQPPTAETQPTRVESPPSERPAPEPVTSPRVGSPTVEAPAAGMVEEPPVETQADPDPEVEVAEQTREATRPRMRHRPTMHQEARMEAQREVATSEMRDTEMAAEQTMTSTSTMMSASPNDIVLNPYRH